MFSNSCQLVKEAIKINKYRYILTFTLIFLFITGSLLYAGNKKGNKIPHKPPVPATEKAKGDISQINPKIFEANKEFGFKLFSEMTKENTEENLFISPPSIMLALSMTYNGADGETKDAMAEAMHIQGISLEEINKGNKILIDFLTEKENNELTLANSLWCREHIEFNKIFKENCENYYYGEIENRINENLINNWVNEKTKEKINNIVDTIPDDTVLAIMNAIYFKGTWKEPFNPEKTENGIFRLSDGTEKEMAMMKKEGAFSYCSFDNFQAVSLPYSGNEMSMYIFLPDEDYSLEEFQKELNKENWQQWTAMFSDTEGQLILPRFKIEYEKPFILNRVLSDMGMELAFTGSADFNRMTEEKNDFFISEVRHKTFLEVNEEGTEAAGTTMVMIGRSIDNFIMEVNRPFFCAITDNKTGIILFMGTIEKPL